MFENKILGTLEKLRSISMGKYASCDRKGLVFISFLIHATHHAECFTYASAFTVFNSWWNMHYCSQSTEQETGNSQRFQTTFKLGHKLPFSSGPDINPDLLN